MKGLRSALNFPGAQTVASSSILSQTTHTSTLLGYGNSEYCTVLNITWNTVAFK